MDSDYLLEAVKRTPLEKLKLPQNGYDNSRIDFVSMFREPLGFSIFTEHFLQNESIEFHKAKFIKDAEKFRLISKEDKRKRVAGRIINGYFPIFQGKDRHENGRRAILSPVRAVVNGKKKESYMTVSESVAGGEEGSSLYPVDGFPNNGEPPSQLDYNKSTSVFMTQRRKSFLESMSTVGGDNGNVLLWHKQRVNRRIQSIGMDLHMNAFPTRINKPSTPASQKSINPISSETSQQSRMAYGASSRNLGITASPVRKTNKYQIQNGPMNRDNSSMSSPGTESKRRLSNGATIIWANQSPTNKNIVSNISVGGGGSSAGTIEIASIKATPFVQSFRASRSNTTNISTSRSAIIVSNATTKATSEEQEELMVILQNFKSSEISYRLFDQLSSTFIKEMEEKHFPSFKDSFLFQRYLQLRHLAEKNVEKKDYLVLREIGKGAFGRVFACKRKISGRANAIKMMSKKFILQHGTERHVMAELDVLSRLTSPFVTRLHYAFQDESNLFLGMDLCLAGDLKYHIRRMLKKNKRLPTRLIRFWAAEILLAIEHLHDNNIIHRDLKPDNVLIDDSGHCRLADFGMACFHTGTLKEVAGTPGYWAPEIIRHEDYDSAVDIWGFGCIMYEMFIGYCPFHEGAENVKLPRKERIKMRSQNTLHKEVRFTEIFHEPIASLLAGLLVRAPTERLGYKNFKDIKEHPFFEAIDWGLLATGAVIPPLPSRWASTFPQGTMSEFSCLPNQPESAVDSDKKFKDFRFVNFQLAQKELVEIVEHDSSLTSQPVVKQKSCCTIM
eukprot:TRINITY_DN160_c2_g1_i1.p1 TRINITY_DN160_c2_g1~~TRINITY_DN160_c2_g1_i1.p1  ORF type:complete len:785 (-),score=180.94 TRINITY_DN160_c2_g1_i1:1121-3475(-)